MKPPISTFDLFRLATPADHCSNCNGFGSSLKEDSDRCSVCGGTGLKPAAAALLRAALRAKPEVQS